MDVVTLYYILAGALILAGLAGVILPALPGLPLVFAGMLLAAWAGGFEKIGVGTLVALGVLTALSMVVDFWAAAHGAKRVGASRLALAGAVLGTFVGIFLGPIGLFVGPFVGALSGELLHGRSLDRIGHATRVGFGTWFGLVLGIALKLMLAFAMLGLFAWSWFYG
jgi:uncharacterized protein YqgC (DUF456 family)